ncbi:MAG TPA: D-Ala-D-Ala carboxypeptidase family metallohydrolase [Phenylobacterium sp.]|nr:D-Ala-D-Ala carboxypeptidase family metallohydrolase [Phenylobacterium sp.]
MNTWLSPHFSLEELTATRHRELGNRPGPAALAGLRRLAATLEAVRRLLGDHPVIITSGFRSGAVNRAVGGAAGSAHLRGEAADFICPRFGPPEQVCRAIAGSDIAFDQLIEEAGRWTHLAIGGAQRRQVLSWRPGEGYRPGLAA